MFDLENEHRSVDFISVWLYFTFSKHRKVHQGHAFSVCSFLAIAFFFQHLPSLFISLHPPITCISLITASMNLLSGRPLLLFAGGSILSIHYPTQLSSLLHRCNFFSLTFPAQVVPLNFILIPVYFASEDLKNFSSATSSSFSCHLPTATIETQ